VSIAGVIRKRSRLVEVLLPGLATRGPDGRATSAAPVTAVVKLHVQPGTARPTTLRRDNSGDQSSGGEARVWVTDSEVAKAFELGDGAETPLGLVTLPFAPPEDADGPPGARVAWNGRSWELTEDEAWSENGAYQRYMATDRGAA